MAFIAGINRKKGEVNTHPDKRKCKDCPDEIYWQGKTPKNYKDCSGGKKDKDHICVNRLNAGSTYYEFLSRKILICDRCGSRYPGLFVDCPACFKLMCQACGTLRDWRYDRPAGKKIKIVKTKDNGEEEVIITIAGCPHCGCAYSSFVTVSRLNEYGKYVKCDPWDSVKREPVRAYGFDKARQLGLIH